MVEREKTFRVPTSKSELTRKLAQIPGDEINLVFDPKTGQYTIEVPEIETAQVEREIGRVPAKLFLQAVREVAFAAAREGEEPFRQILEGVLFKFETDRLTLVAGDSYRLSVSRMRVPFALRGEVILGAEELKKACRTLFPRGKGAKDAWIQFLSKPEGVEIKFVDEETGESVPRTEGTYPDYWGGLISEPTMGITFQRKEFLEKLKSFDKKEPVRIEYLEEEGVKKLRLYQKLWQEGEGRVEKEELLPVDGFSLLHNKAAFQYRYLLDLLKNVHSDALRMEFTGETKAAAFRKVPDENFIHLVMPMRVPW